MRWIRRRVEEMLLRRALPASCTTALVEEARVHDATSCHASAAFLSERVALSSDNRSRTPAAPARTRPLSRNDLLEISPALSARHLRLHQEPSRERSASTALPTSNGGP